MTFNSFPLSVLDLVFVNQGSSPTEAFKNSVQLAQKVDDLGFNRLWIAEHHNMPAIASAATAVVIGHLAGHTKKIKLGAGGIMLPNHSPLVIAEQFGTLATLYPGRIELGLGRAPGTDQKTMRALRRENLSAQTFPQDVLELQKYFDEPSDDQQIKAIPGMGLKVPLWILGSSLFGSQLAASMGLPYAFASHFAPDALYDALSYYRSHFKPSKQLEKSYAMIGVNIIVADTDAEARRLFTSVQQSFVNMTRNKRGTFPPPIDDINRYWSPDEEMIASQMLSCSLIGSKLTVKEGLRQLLRRTGVDELMVVTSVYDNDARLYSFDLLSELSKEL